MAPPATAPAGGWRARSGRTGRRGREVQASPLTEGRTAAAASAREPPATDLQAVLAKLRESTMALAEADAQRVALAQDLKDAEEELRARSSRSGAEARERAALVDRAEGGEEARRRAKQLEELLSDERQQVRALSAERNGLRRRQEELVRDNERLRTQSAAAGAELSREREMASAAGRVSPASAVRGMGSPDVVAAGRPSTSPLLPSTVIRVNMELEKRLAREQELRQAAEEQNRVLSAKLQDQYVCASRDQTHSTEEVVRLKQCVQERDAEIGRLADLYKVMAGSGGARSGGAGASGAAGGREHARDSDLEAVKAENAQLNIQVAERDSLIATLRSEARATQDFARKSEGQQEEFRMHLTRVTNAFIPAVASLTKGPPRPPGNFVTPEEVSMIVAELIKSRQDLALAANRLEELRAEAAVRSEELESARGESVRRKRAEEEGSRARAELAPAVQEAERLGEEVRRLEGQNGMLREALGAADLDRQVHNLERAEVGGTARSPFGGGMSRKGGTASGSGGGAATPAVAAGPAGAGRSPWSAATSRNVREAEEGSKGVPTTPEAGLAMLLMEVQQMNLRLDAM